MHKGLMKSLPLYPMKYLIDLFVPYGSFLETNILLASILSKKVFFSFCKNYCFDLFLVENYSLSTHSFTG